MNYNLRRTCSRDFKADERISGKIWTKLSTASSDSCTATTFRCEHIYKLTILDFIFLPLCVSTKRPVVKKKQLKSDDITLIALKVC